MSRLWRRLFRRVKVVPLKLGFSLDMDTEGRHQVHVQKVYDDRFEIVADVRPLFRYGYREESFDGREVHVVSEVDWQILQSIRNLNPKLAADGALIFDILPPVLAYLRQQKNVRESDTSQQITIQIEPLEPRIVVDFNPEVGAEVKVSYRDSGSSDAISHSQLSISPDGHWARFGNRFVALPKPLNSAQAHLFQQGGRKVPLVDVPEFFQRDLVLYRNQFNAVMTDLASQVRVIDEPLQLVFHLDQNAPGWLSFQVEYHAGDVSVTHDQIMKASHQQYYRLTPTTWLKVNHKRTQEVAEGYEKLGAESTSEGFRVPARAFANLEEFIQEVGGTMVVSQAYQQYLDQLIGFKWDDTFPLSPVAEADLARVGVILRRYQRGGIQWLNWLSINGLHGVLADDMGLGKTLQAIAAMRLAYERTLSQQHSLIITPKSVLYHWERELNRFFPSMLTHVYHGPARRIDLLQSARPITFITTYSTATNDVDAFAKIPLLYLVLDEATQIKNPTALRTNAVKSLNATHRLALSGTPVENRPSELWSLFDFLMRGHLGRQVTFQHQFEAPIMNGDRSATEKLRRRIQPFMLRRMKTEVAEDLPPKIECEEWCELTGEQRQLYGAMQDQARRLTILLKSGVHVDFTSSILPILTHLMQICDHPSIINQRSDPLNGRSEKFDWVVEKLEEIIVGQEQVVIFSRFLGMLSLLERATQERSIGYIRIDGSTVDRQARIDRFNDGKAQVALCSLLATGHGINLTSANHVIHADRWWNPAVEDQATDRVHRIGQSRTVHVHRIIVGGTLEERLDRLLKNKRDMIDRIVGFADRPLGGWTREELIELLRPLD